MSGNRKVRGPAAAPFYCRRDLHFLRERTGDGRGRVPERAGTKAEAAARPSARLEVYSLLMEGVRELLRYAALPG